MWIQGLKKMVFVFVYIKLDIFEKYDHLSEDELNKKNSKKVYVKNNVMLSVIKILQRWRKGQKKNKWIQKKI